jgi:hypothetical protein
MFRYKGCRKDSLKSMYVINDLTIFKVRTLEHIILETIAKNIKSFIYSAIPNICQ